MLGLLGKKLGMTQIFNDEGRLIPVTVIEAGPCPVLEKIKTGVKEKVKLGFEQVQEDRLKKPQAGYFKKLGIPAQRHIVEFDIEAGTEISPKQNIKVDIFKVGDYVNVQGTSIGKGFQGGMKRWHWHGGPKTHGSTSHRRIGSVGSSSDPSRVFRGHHMPGHMGNCRVTVQNLEVVKVDPDNNILFVKGAVPGYDSRFLVIHRAKKIRKALPKQADTAEAKKAKDAKAKKDTAKK